MKIFAISPRTLSLLDTEFHGKIGGALAEVARIQCEPELRAERFRTSPNEPSTWTIIVTGDGAERRFDANRSMVATAIAAHLLVADFAAEVRADLASRVHAQDTLDDLGDKVLWSREPGDGGLS